MDDKHKNEELKMFQETVTLLDDRLDLLSKQCTSLQESLSKSKSPSLDNRQLQILRHDITKDIQLLLPKSSLNKELFIKQLKWLGSFSVTVVLLTIISQWLFTQFYQPPVQVTQATVVGKLLFKAMNKMEPLQKAKLMTALAKEMTGYTEVNP